MARGSAEDDPDGLYQLYDDKTNEVPRLRRSLRGSRTGLLSREAQFEKIISKIADMENKSSDPGSKGKEEDLPALRQFHIPSHILLNIDEAIKKKIKRKGKKVMSAFEKLDTSTALHILSFLEGNHLIMLALTCKTMASWVEASPTRKIANISNYARWPDKPGYLVPVIKGTPPGEFVRRGYRYPPSREWYDESCAARKQAHQLFSLVEKYLGYRKFRFCEHCGIFRVMNPKWYQQLAEYENPGILSNPNAAENLSNHLRDWTFFYCIVDTCPAHLLFAKDEHGNRTITNPPPPRSPSPSPHPS